MARLTILLPAKRDRCGRAVLASSSGELLFGPFRILGTASRLVSRRMGNPIHDRLRPFGDPPCGTYVVATSLPPGKVHPRRPGRFGKLGGLVLQPTGGEALAAVAHGRDHVVLHGGPLDKQRRLRRTRGGLRVGNARLVGLLDAVNRTQAAGDPLSVVEIVDAGTELDGEPVLPPATPRRRDRHGSGVSMRARRRGGAPPVTAAAAMAVFGIRHASDTRRNFLAAALLAVASVKLLGCADSPARCVDACDPAGSGSGSGSGSSSNERALTSTSGSGSGSKCVCDDGGDDDYGTGGGIG